MNAPVVGGVLVGGESRRMGRLKQFVEIGESTMIESVVHSLSGEVSEVVLLGGGPVPSSLEGLSRVADAEEYSLHRLISSSRVETAQPPAALRRCWFNANTPQELGSLRVG